MIEEIEVEESNVIDEIEVEENKVIDEIEVGENKVINDVPSEFQCLIIMYFRNLSMYCF